MRRFPLTVQRSIFALTFPLLLLSGSALAAPPDPCTFFSVEELNKLAKGGDAVRAEKAGSGRTEAQCNWMKQGGDNVMNITIRQTPNAAEDLKHMAKVQLAMYKKPVKTIAGVGDEAWWGDHNRMLVFRKGDLLVSMYWGGSQYGEEESTVAVSKLVAAKLK